jgi:hypothetical protein
MARGKHLFPFRTEKLSPSAPMVLGARAPGRVGRRRDNDERAAQKAALLSLSGGRYPLPAGTSLAGQIQPPRPSPSTIVIWRERCPPKPPRVERPPASEGVGAVTAPTRRPTGAYPPPSSSGSSRSSSNSPRGGQSSWASQRLVQCRLATF